MEIAHWVVFTLVYSFFLQGFKVVSKTHKHARSDRALPALPPIGQILGDDGVHRQRRLRVRHTGNMLHEKDRMRKAGGLAFAPGIRWHLLQDFHRQQPSFGHLFGKLPGLVIPAAFNSGQLRRAQLNR